MSATRVRSGAHWASWGTFTEVEHEVPRWTSLAREEVVFAEEPEHHEPKIGRQQQAVKNLHQKFHQEFFGQDLQTLQWL